MMQIILNNEPIRFQLENEETIWDVICGIEAWLLKNQLLLRQINLDGQLFFPSESERLKKNLITHTRIVKLQAVSVKEHAIDTLIDLDAYVKLMLNHIEQLDELDWACWVKTHHISDGMAWIESSLNLIVDTLALDVQGIFHDFKSYVQIIDQYKSLLEKINRENEKSDAQHCNISKDEVILTFKMLIKFIPKIFYRACFMHFDVNHIPRLCLKEGIQDIDSMMKNAIKLIKSIHECHRDENKVANQYQYIMLVIQNMSYYFVRICSYANATRSSLKMQHDSIQDIDNELKHLFQETMMIFSSGKKGCIDEFIQGKLKKEIQKYIAYLHKIMICV